MKLTMRRMLETAALVQVGDVGEFEVMYPDGRGRVGDLFESSRGQPSCKSDGKNRRNRAAHVTIGSPHVCEAASATEGNLALGDANIAPSKLIHDIGDRFKEDAPLRVALEEPRDVELLASLHLPSVQDRDLACGLRRPVNPRWLRQRSASAPLAARPNRCGTGRLWFRR